MRIELFFLVVLAIIIFAGIWISNSTKPSDPGYNLSTFLCSEAPNYKLSDSSLVFSSEQSCQYTFSPITNSDTYFVGKYSPDYSLEEFSPKQKIELEESCQFISGQIKPTTFVIGTNDKIFLCQNELGQ